jgi:hypothetical protein
LPPSEERSSMTSKYLTAIPAQEPLSIQLMYQIFAQSCVFLRKGYCTLNLLFPARQCTSNSTRRVPHPRRAFVFAARVGGDRPRKTTILI